MLPSNDSASSERAVDSACGGRRDDDEAEEVHCLRTAVEEEEHGKVDNTS